VRSRRTLVISIALVAILAVPAAASARALLIGGSTSMLPLTEKLAAAYHKYTHHPKPKVYGGQSDIGIHGVATGRYDIADVSRNPEEHGEPHHLVYTRVARDGVCIITNNANPVADMSQTTVEKIFNGTFTNWTQVPGSPLKGKSINVFDRDSSSGTQDAFQHIFFKNPNTKITPRASAESSNGLERANVNGTPGGIGFVSLDFTQGVHRVPYKGVPCTLHNARTGKYKGVRNFWMVTKHAPKGEALRFIRWVTSGNRITKSIISSNWIAVH